MKGSGTSLRNLKRFHGLMLVPGILLLTSCFVLGPHGGPALWVPGAGIVAPSGGGYEAPISKPYGKGDGQSPETAVKLKSIRTEDQLRFYENAGLPFQGQHTDHILKRERFKEGKMVIERVTYVDFDQGVRTNIFYYNITGLRLIGDHPQTNDWSNGR